MHDNVKICHVLHGLVLFCTSFLLFFPYTYLMVIIILAAVPYMHTYMMTYAHIIHASFQNQHTDETLAFSAFCMGMCAVRNVTDIFVIFY